MMKAFKNFTGLVAPLDRPNVDTDQIIPKQFLKAVVRSGLAKGLFFDWRNQPDKGYVLDQPRFKGASILVARANFGCGSSREHAVWALTDFGFKAAIAGGVPKAKAGILVIPDPQEWTVMFNHINERQFDVVAMGFSGQAPSEDPYQIFHSSQMAGAGDDFVQFKDQEVDDAIVQARETLDHDKRTELWHKVDRLIHEQEPYTFLYADNELSLVDNRIHGVEPTRLGLLFRIQEWYVPKALQKYTQ